MDPSNNKLYTPYTRTHGYHHASHGHTRDLSRTESMSGAGSPLPSMPSLVTPDYSMISSSLTQSLAMNGRMILPVTGGVPRTWQRNPRDVLQVLTESFLERRRPYGHGKFRTILAIRMLFIFRTFTDDYMLNSKMER